MVMTNNKKYYNLLKKFRCHGLSKEFKDRENSDDIQAYEYDIELLGFNYRLTDIQAVLGISQLKKINLFMKKKQKIKNYFLKELNNSENVECLEYKFDSGNHLFIVKVKKGKEMNYIIY